MALPWVKIYTRILDDDDFRELSERAQHTYLVAIIQAGKCGEDGRLVLRSGPMTVAQIANKTSMPVKEQGKALDELVRIGFLTRIGPEYAVDRWAEFQGDTTATERKQQERLKAAGLTEEDWQEIIARQKRRCAFCHAEKSLLIDHILPKALGGKDEPRNIQALCRSCSGRKNAGLQQTLKKEQSDNPLGKHEGRHGDDPMGSHNDNPTGSHALDIDKEEDVDNPTHTPRASLPEDHPTKVAEFVRWFVAAGVESRAVPKHLDFEMEVAHEATRSGKAATALLKAYGRAECERRAHLFFARLLAPNGMGNPWITTLAERWAWFEPRNVTPITAPRPHNPDHDLIPAPLESGADLAAIFQARKEVL